MYSTLQNPIKACRLRVVTTSKNCDFSVEMRVCVARGTLHNPLTSAQFWPNTYSKAALYYRVKSIMNGCERSAPASVADLCRHKTFDYVCFMRKEERPKICCVYFLFLKKQLIYIGQTVDFRKRMSGHEYQYLHDSVRWIECPKDKLEHYEKRLIKILQPLANYQFNKKNRDRVKLTYKHPIWVNYWNRMNRISKGLESGRKDPDTTRYYLKQATREFKSRYKRQGYKGTFLDPLTPAPI
jgi:hypothetical protein